ncbi:MAG: hypothetical protein QG576_620 [Bacteroidota bacterium]|nr:hypothetical protein [Bacteroidota bacterium]
MQPKSNLMIIFSIIILSGCREVAVPKPKGFFRIDLPPREYTLFNGNILNTAILPVSFEYPVYGNIILNDNYKSEPGWFNIEFPSYKAKIYLTYKDLKSNIDTLMEETYRLNVKNHITKADAINELVISDPDNRVYGILYDLKGNTATAVQFFITDSISHFLRGSLYFEAEPDPDSLAPVINFFREDIIHIIETTQWKKE